MVVPVAAAATGGFFSNPAVQAALANAGVGLGMAGAQGLYNRWNPDPSQQQHQAAQGELLQGLRQPYQANFQNISNEAKRRYQQETLPGLANRFASLGGLNSSGFANSLKGSGQDLETQLAALQEGVGANEYNMNQSRLGQLGGYLGGQQNLAQRQNEFGAQNRLDWAKTGLGYGQLGARFKELYDPSRSLQSQAALGLGQYTDTIKHLEQMGLPAEILDTIKKYFTGGRSV